MRQVSAVPSADFYGNQDVQSFDTLGFAIHDIASMDRQSSGAWVEWLVRPTGLSAVAYVEAVQRFGLAIEFDQAVLQAAVRWLQFQPASTQLSVNVFANSISNKKFTGFVDQLICDSNICPRQLCFEITEHHAIENLMAATEFAKHVRSLGCSVALDDIGTGNMHVGLLAPLQLVDFVKIDRSWVTPALDSARHKQTLDALVRFARRMKLEVVLEGIETEDHMQLVIESGAEYYQGFVNGEPRLVEINDHDFTQELTEAI